MVARRSSTPFSVRTYPAPAASFTSAVTVDGSRPMARASFLHGCSPQANNWLHEDVAVRRRNAVEAAFLQLDRNEAVRL